MEKGERIEKAIRIPGGWTCVVCGTASDVSKDILNKWVI